MTNVPTKLEVPSFTRYGDMKVVEKCTKWGGLWWLGVTQGLSKSPFDRAHMTSYSSLIETMCLSRTIFETRQVICRNSSTLPYTTSIWCPRSNFKKIFGIKKVESLGYCVALFA